jgi:hypothetical protein
MALTRITPMPARVRWDRQADRPSLVTWGANRLEVTSLAKVRDERHAHRAGRSPRITLTVAAARGQAVLVFDAQQHRWYVEAVDLAA